MLRLLIVKTSSLGDVIHNLPIVADIRTHNPDVRIDWLVEEGFADIPRLHPGVDAVMTVAARRWRKNLLSSQTWSEIAVCKRSLRNAKYDLVLDTQGLLKSAIFANFSQAPIHGQDKHSARESLAACFYQYRHTVPRGTHAVVRNRQLAAAALQYSLPETPPSFGLCAGLELGDEPAFNSANPYVIGLHGTSRDAKLWPTEHWVTLGNHLSDGQISLILPWGTEAEYQRAQTIAASVPMAMVLPRLGIRELINVFAGAQAAVGVDTGLAHLAVALRLPTIAIYTDTDPTLTGLYPEAGAHAVNLGGRNQMPAPSTVIENIKRFL
ncbi:MAG TPA: lipopolysaccharide heptosyltransferase I [Methylophilaceae bacterium]|nr:lipopolysaccharide heptosyltransferase I [Methylophilaceae bacterium]